MARQERWILRVGEPLPPREIEIAVRVGIRRPERIRLLRVERVPVPIGGILGAAAKRAGFGFDDIGGMTMRYGIFIKSDCWGNLPLLAHELAHTRQYEDLGGLYPFLYRYLREYLSDGYLGSSLEHEAYRIGMSFGASD